MFYNKFRHGLKEKGNFPETLTLLFLADESHAFAVEIKNRETFIIVRYMYSQVPAISFSII